MLNIVDLPVHAAQTREVPRDGWGRPLVVPKAGGKPVGLTRCTTFIDAIEDKSNLIDWGKRMVLVGAAKYPSLLDDVRGLDPNDPKDKPSLNNLAERATAISGANDKREKGTHLHTLSEYVDRGEALPPGTSGADLRDMSAYMMATVGLEVMHVEQFVVVPELSTGGTFDRMVRYSGPDPDGKHIEGTFIADLKTGSVQYGGLKMASQLAVYSRGELYDYELFPVDAGDKKALAAWKKTAFPADRATQAYAALPPVSQDWGIIIHLPAGTGECTLYWVDLNVGWAAAKLALEIRRMRGKSKSAMRPFVSQVTKADVASLGANV